MSIQRDSAGGRDGRKVPRQAAWIPIVFLLAVMAVPAYRLVVPGDTPERPPELKVLEQTVHDFEIFATYGRLTLWAPAGDGEAAAREIIERLQRLHDTINVFDSESELARLNRTAAESPFACSDDLWAIIQAARRVHRETAGAFDVSIGPLMRLWGFHRKRDSLPTKQEIDDALTLVGLHKIQFDDEAKTVQFPKEGMYLDFGGIAKGYGLDLATPVLDHYGITTGMVDLGGNIHCLENVPEGRDAYRIGIQDPHDTDGLMNRMALRDQATATSGNYERHVEIEGRRIEHIINPKTGQPVGNVASVTVVTPRGVDSDAFSTSIFVAGDDLARTFVASRERTGVAIVRPGPDGNAELVTFGDVDLLD